MDPQIEEKAIDQFYTIINRFEQFKPTYRGTYHPAKKHDLLGIRYLGSPFFNPTDQDCAFLDKGLHTSDFKSNWKSSFLGWHGTTIISYASVDKMDPAIRGRIDYKKSFPCKNIYETLSITYGDGNDLDFTKRPVAQAFYMGAKSDNKITFVDANKGPPNHTFATQFEDCLRMLMCGDHYYEYVWHAQIAHENIGIKVPIHPNTARFFFKNRAPKAGNDRRSAIRNFVKEHNRYIRSQPDPVIIKKHLRGNTQFEWFGLNVTILPAEADLRELKRDIV